MDRRQVVRHWVLVPAFAGSNPAGPAKKIPELCSGIFLAFSARMRTVGATARRSE